MTSSTARPLGIRDVLRIADYRRIWLAQAVSDIGDATTFLLLLLVVNELTGSTAALAVMSIALVTPRFTVGLVAGAYVDRWDRRRVMLAADLLRAGVVLGFVLVHSPAGVPLLVALGFAESSIGSFFTPARNALLPHIVPRHGLPAANSLTQATRVLGTVIGSAIAGLLFSAYGAAWPGFVLDAATFGASFLLVLGVAASAGRIMADTADHPAMLGVARSIREGLVIVRDSRLLLGTLLGVSTAMLGIGAVNVLFVPLLVNELDVSPAWMAAIDGAEAISIVLATTIVAWLTARISTTAIITVALAGIAVVTLGLAGVTSVWQVIALLFAVGWFVTPLQAASSTIIQTAVADTARGRVGSLMSATTSTANAVSMALAGIFADLFSVRIVYVLAAGACALAALVAFVVFRGVRDGEASADVVGDVSSHQGNSL